MKTTFTLRLGVIIALVFIAALSRIIPHPYNFTPLSAIALFGAAHFKKDWQVIFILIVATWLSDLVINNLIYSPASGFVWFYKGFYWQYGTYVLIALLGRKTLTRITVSRVLLSSIGAAGVFFLVSNFGVWAGSPMYPQTFSGLVTCYAAGLPFFGGTLFGNLFYGVALFGVFHLLEQNWEGIKVTVRS
jgi:hypothetical protein